MPVGAQSILCRQPGYGTQISCRQSSAHTNVRWDFRLKPKSINTIKSIRLLMARAIHLLAYVCKIGDNERDVIINCSTNNDKLYFECEMNCGRHCVFNNREYQLIGKHVSNDYSNKD